MPLSRLVLLISGLLFALLGAGFLVWPARWAEFVDIFLPTSTARTDLRATYGGFDLAFGMFLLVTGARRDWIRPGLVACGLAFSGLAGGRLLGFWVEGTGIPRLYAFFAIEVIGGALAFYAFSREQVR